MTFFNWTNVFAVLDMSSVTVYRGVAQSFKEAAKADPGMQVNLRLIDSTKSIDYDTLLRDFNQISRGKDVLHATRRTNG